MRQGGQVEGRGKSIFKEINPMPKANKAWVASG